MRSRPRYPAPIEWTEFPESVSSAVWKYEEKAINHLRAARESVSPSAWSSDRALPERFLKHLERAYHLVDESHRIVLKHLRESGSPVRCQPGCAHCCTQMPSGITGVEILYLYARLTLSGERERGFRRSLERQEVWAQLCRWKKLPEQRPGESILLRLHEYHSLDLVCPFLQGDLCSVYAERPFACRMHYSLSSPYWCRPSHFQHEHAVRFNLEPSAEIYRELEKLDEVLKLELSDLLICGFLEMVVNVMRFRPITWIPEPK